MNQLPGHAAAPLRFSSRCCYNLAIRELANCAPMVVESSSLTADLGNGKFDGAWLVVNFESLNPANALWDKYYKLYDNVDTEPARTEAGTSAAAPRRSGKARNAVQGRRLKLGTRPAGRRFTVGMSAMISRDLMG